MRRLFPPDVLSDLEALVDDERRARADEKLEGGGVMTQRLRDLLKASGGKARKLT